MLSTAPNTVVQVIILTDEPQPFIGVVPEETLSILSLTENKTPVLNSHMLGPCAAGGEEVIGSDRNCSAIKVGPDLAASKTEECRGQIRVRGDYVADVVFGNPGASYDKRHVYIFFETTFFARLQPVLSNVVAIVT